MVVDALRDGQQARAGGEGARIGRHGPVGDGEHAAVEVEADDGGHRVGVDRVRRDVEVREVGRQLGEPSRDAEQRPDGVR